VVNIHCMLAESPEEQNTKLLSMYTKLEQLTCVLSLTDVLTDGW